MRSKGLVPRLSRYESRQWCSLIDDEKILGILQGKEFIFVGPILSGYQVISATVATTKIESI